MSTQHLSQSPAETFALGEALGRELGGLELIYLKGDLGAGKTLFTKGLARGMGIDPDEIVSPTFTLVNEYSSGGKKPRRLFHVDLYRLGAIRSGALPEIDDHIGNGVIVIEWAQYLPPAYFTLEGSREGTIEVTFQPVEGNDNARNLEIKRKIEGKIEPKP